MKKVIENIADLLKVKTIVTFVVLWIFAGACAKGAISESVITTIVSMVFAFYFGTQVDKKKHDETTPSKEESSENDDNR